MSAGRLPNTTTFILASWGVDQEEGANPNTGQNDDIVVSQNNAAMYLFGHGVENDAEKATLWLESAAARGQVDAQSILGIMYATGQGVTRNIPAATKWLTRASEAGDKHAMRVLQIIEELHRLQ